MLARAGRADYLHRYYGRWIDAPADRGFSHRPRWDTVTGVLENYLSPALKHLLERAPDWDAEYLDALPAGFDEWAGLDKAQLLEAETLLAGYLLSAQGDRPAMAHSVEGRFPYLDYRVAQEACGLPARVRLPVLHEKQALKDAARGVLPAEVLERPKQPYMAPDAPSFFEEGAPDWVDEMLSPERLRRYGLFDPDAVDALARKMRRRSGGLVGFRDNQLVVGLLSTQLLMRDYIDEPESLPAPPAGDFRDAVALGA
jgi:asparagine synthase (glutamine-hydrolysing)